MLCLQALLSFQVNVFHSYFPFKLMLQSSPKELEIPCVLAMVFFGSGHRVYFDIYLYITLL